MSVLKQYHYLYKITNLINNKIYIGIHSTNRMNDGYFGSGKALKHAFKKYGKANFTKEILEWFDWRIEVSNREAEIVNEEFINRSDTYNNQTGGDNSQLMSEDVKLKIGKAKIGNSYNIGRKNSEESIKNMSLAHIGIKHTTETKIKVSISSKERWKNPEFRKLQSEFGKKCSIFGEIFNSLTLGYIRYKELNPSYKCVSHTFRRDLRSNKISNCFVLDINKV